MLNIRRRKEEEITIIYEGEELLTLKITQLSSSIVQLGFKCRDDVKIIRTELLDQE